MSKLTMTTFLSLDGVVQSPSTPTEDPSGDFRQGGLACPVCGRRHSTVYGQYAIQCRCSATRTEDLRNSSRPLPARHRSGQIRTTRWH
jgi:hypothetical protein